MMQHRMDPPFERKQHKCNDGQYKLEPARALFFFRQWLQPPLRRGAAAQTPLPPQHIEIHKSAHQGQRHHRNANRILVKSAHRSIASSRRGQRSQANQHANTADRKYRRTSALHKREGKAGPADPASSTFCGFHQTTAPLSIASKSMRFIDRCYQSSTSDRQNPSLYGQ